MKQTSESGFSPVIIVFGIIVLIAAGMIIVNRNPMPRFENTSVDQTVTVENNASSSASLIASPSAASKKVTVKATATPLPVKFNPTIVPTSLPTNVPVSTPNAAEEQKKKEEMIKEALKNKTPYPISDQDKQLILQQYGQ